MYFFEFILHLITHNNAFVDLFNFIQYNYKQHLDTLYSDKRISSQMSVSTLCV